MLCHPHAQRTKQLQEALCQLGQRVGGQAGADVGSELGINGSCDTILSLVRQSHSSAQSEPRIIGLDDWARKRRLRYGTLICDLEVPRDAQRDRRCLRSSHEEEADNACSNFAAVEGEAA